ncbi:DUF4142 domain-containing protein [Streptomyces somaliensis]|uniref:DUF4142 domain-containing protein n=1 Tax=Streptomyces somaliensis TaxID=78355 RepID=UPI0034E984AD|nr:DUF4142 domain-containing protein [Streptomyces somaliensis]
MRTYRWAATALTCLALSGIAAAPALAADAPPTDHAFLRAAHQGNLTEIAAGRDAGKNATTACVKKVGAVLVRDHTKLDAAARALADKLGVDLPTAPSPEQQRVLASVMAKAGTGAYDAAWLKAQDAAHTKTLRMIDHQIAEGREASVTAAAKAARPVVAHHLSMVRGGTCHEDAAHVPNSIHARQRRPGRPRRRGRARVPRGTGHGRRRDARRGRGLLGRRAHPPQRPPLTRRGRPPRADRRTRPRPPAGLGRGRGRRLGGPGAPPPGRGAVRPAGRGQGSPRHRHGGPGRRDRPLPAGHPHRAGPRRPHARRPGRRDRGRRAGPARVAVATRLVGAGRTAGRDGRHPAARRHLDSAEEGPGPFEALHSLPIGALAHVAAADGSRHTYRIVARRTYRAGALPGDLFSAEGSPRLALVTCAGAFDPEERVYAENLVLYGVPV